jgi:hypothetical protein
MKEVTRGHSAPQACSDYPASAPGRVATPCLGAGAGRWTWEQRGSWTLDETGNRARQRICKLSTLGIGGVKKIRRGHGGVGMMEAVRCRMIIVGGRGGGAGVDSKVFHCHQGQQRKRCPGSRDPSQCLRNLGEHMHSVPVGTNYNVCLPTCKDHETSDSGADRLDLKPSPLQIVPNHSTLLAYHSVDGHFGRSVYPSH